MTCVVARESKLDLGARGGTRLFQPVTQEKKSSSRSERKGVRRKTQGFKETKRRAKETRCLPGGFRILSEPPAPVEPD